MTVPARTVGMLIRVCLPRSFATKATGEDATALSTGRLNAPKESSDVNEGGEGAATVSRTAIYAVVSRRRDLRLPIHSV
jgi:hypothetical protein